MAQEKKIKKSVFKLPVQTWLYSCEWWQVLSWVTCSHTAFSTGLQIDEGCLGRGMYRSCGEKAAVASRTSALFTARTGKCAVNKMEQGEVSRDGLLNAAWENLIFFLMLPEFHRALNHITSLTFFTGDACVLFSLWISYLSPSVWLVEMKWRTFGVSNGDQESSALLWRNVVQ